MRFITNSLYGRLLASIALLMISALLFSSILTQRKVNHQINDNYDIQLIADANILWSLVHEEIEEPQGDSLHDLSLDPRAANLEDEQKLALINYNNWRAFRIWSHGKLLVKSEHAADKKLPPFTPGFSATTTDDGHWRIYTLSYPKYKATVEAWENLGNRSKIQNELQKNQLAMASWGFPILTLVLLLTIWSALSGLSRLVDQIRRTTPDKMNGLIAPKNLPRELTPMLDAINQMISRLDRAMVRERHFINNVSHELRTPLATMRILTKNIRSAPNEQERLDDVVALDKCIHKTGELIDHLLLLSRIEQDQTAVKTVINLDQIARTILGEFSLVAAERQIELDLTTTNENGTIINANEALVYVLMRVLLDNAIKYTPANGTVKISISPNNIRITDTGPGIPAAERDQVFERFYRGTNTKLTTTGSGLGMTIAQQACRALGAKITLRDPDDHQGLCVNVTFDV